MSIKLTELKVKYGAVMALNGVSLNVASKKVTVLLGANGAGKSSLIRCIMGLVQADAGEIWFDDIRIDKLSPHQISQFGLSLVPEGRRVFPGMTVLENLYVGAHRRKGKRKEVNDELNEIWSYFPVLQKKKDQSAGSLSGGEQQMLAFGRALMAKPEVLLMDEPSLGLAPLIVKQLADLTVKFNRDQGLTVLMAEQNVRMGLHVADYAYLLENGKIVLEGSGKDLVGHEYIKKAYLGGK